MIRINNLCKVTNIRNKETQKVNLLNKSNVKWFKVKIFAYVKIRY
jgi:hypothetical protein